MHWAALVFREAAIGYMAAVTTAVACLTSLALSLPPLSCRMKMVQWQNEDLTFRPHKTQGDPLCTCAVCRQAPLLRNEHNMQPLVCLLSHSYTATQLRSYTTVLASECRAIVLLVPSIACFSAGVPLDATFFGLPAGCRFPQRVCLKTMQQ
jgi:hypothetical protein